MRRSMSACLAALAVVFVIGLAAGGAVAQSLSDYATLPGSETEPASDPAAEAPGVSPAPPDLEAYSRIADVTAGAIVDSATRQVDIFQQRLRRIVGAVPDTLEEIGAALTAKSPSGDPTYFLGVAIFVLILMIIGRAGGLLFAAYVALPVMVSIQRPDPRGMLEKLPVLATRVGLSAAILLISLLIAMAVGAPFFDDHTPTMQTAVMILGTFAAYFMVDTTWRMVISPYLPNYRIPNISDSDAVLLYRYMSAATMLGIGQIAIAVWLDLMDVRPEVVVFLRIVLGTVTTAFLMLLVLRNRRAITGAILGSTPRREAPWLTAAASFLWAPLLIVYLVLSWLGASFNQIMGLNSPTGLAGVYAVFLTSIVVYAVLMYVVERLFARSRALARARAEAAAADAAEEMPPPGVTEPPDSSRDPSRDEPHDASHPGRASASGADVDDDGDEEGGGGIVAPHSGDPNPVPPEPRTGSASLPPGRRRMHTFEDLARRAVSLFALGTGAFIILRLWVGPGILAEDSVWNVLQDIIDTAFFGYLLYHALRIWMDRRIAEEGGDVVLEPGEGEGGGMSASTRLGTLLPLVRSFVLLVVAASVFLLIGARLGVNVAPLFAGAGIVGLAIGFGAQTLVRDILSGVFFLLDDAFRKGEYIDVGSVKGTVEKISIRSFQLRHHLGPLHTIPFGEIQFLTNYSRDWVIMKLPLRLTYDTDVERLRKIIKKLGQELLEHPLEGPKFVQPLKSQGVYMMEDSAMIIRVKYMTRPGDQWTTRKLVYQRIREIFEKEGIKFAHREVTVRIPGLGKREDLDEEEQQAIGAAARRALDDADQLQGPQPALADGR